MEKTSRTTLLCALFALFPVALGAAGCGGSISAICDEMCDCEGCSDNEYDECIDEGEDLERAAENEGCEDQFDDLLACTADESECRGDDWDADGCEREFLDLNECVGDRNDVAQPDPPPQGG